MIPWFDKTFGPHEQQHLPDDGAVLWDFSRFQPEVFILALGTNDTSEMYPATNEEAYVTRYQGFLDTVRDVYPDATIVALAPFKEGEPWDLVRSHIQVAVNSWNDPKAFVVLPVQGNHPNYTDRFLDYPADYVSGDEYHPNLQGHTKIAERLAPLILARMGWSSDLP
jgi:lysophospholipase L1-like esterase